MNEFLESASKQIRATGRCQCGLVKYEIYGPLRAVVYCHCDMCRRLSGHFLAATACRHNDFKLTEQSGLKWYQSSKTARRGFCQKCGSNLFWEPESKTHISITTGTLDKPTGLSAATHICTESVGDYYRICDDLPQALDANHNIKIPDARS